MLIDWESSGTSVLLNPRIPQEEQAFFHKKLPLDGSFEGHVWLLTSGTTSTTARHKCVALKKQAMLFSASAVNRHLMSGPFDVWMNPLPLFHVGGLGIMARSHLSGAKTIVLPGKWDPHHFYRLLIENRVTLTALVPTQLHDLVSASLVSPDHLRAVVVGGDRLDDLLFRKATALGWKVLSSYGLTEAASQIATAPYGSEEQSLHTLDHVEVRTDQNGYIALKGPSLLTCYAFRRGNDVECLDPKHDGWFLTEDRGILEGPRLSVLGRSSDFVKIGGESVCLALLEKKFNALKSKLRCDQTTVLLAVPDARLGAAVLLVVEGRLDDKSQAVVNLFQEQVLPFERIQRISEEPVLPRTELGKICKNVLLSRFERLSLEMREMKK